MRGIESEHTRVRRGDRQKLAEERDGGTGVRELAEEGGEVVVEIAVIKDDESAVETAELAGVEIL